MDNEFMRVSKGPIEIPDEDKRMSMCIEDDEIPYETVLQKLHPFIPIELRFISKRKKKTERYNAILKTFVLDSVRLAEPKTKWMTKDEYETLKNKTLETFPNFGRRSILFGDINPKTGEVQAFCRDE